MGRTSAVVFAALLACHGGGQETDSDTDTDVADTDVADTDVDTGTPSPTRDVHVVVTLDGAPAPAGVVLTQCGTDRKWTTGDDGTADVVIDMTLDGEKYVAASWPTARINGDDVPGPGEELDIALTSYDPSDNPDYTYQDPGSPTRDTSTNQCAHCHDTIVAYWWDSPHRTAASDPVVQDLYAGAASTYADELACEEAGGRWMAGLEPGTGAATYRCYKGDGALPALNPSCGTDASCDGVATSTGQCADCHAPAIDGALGGHDLLEATGYAYEGGVHCDVCHRVDAIDPDAPAGFAGRLVVLRPSEKPSSAALGEWLPLTFGPWDDVPNVRMGSVARELFHDGSLCSGCHQLDQDVLVPGEAADLSRWPDGKLPIHTTYAEWQEGPYGQGDVACPACHMPPDPSVGNGDDLGNELKLTPGVAGGWYRPAGSVRKHAWYGPSQPESGMLQLAAAIFVDKAVADGELVATVTVKNVGAGHAIPTGEPLRSAVLVVQADCGGVALDATGGDAVPDFGGYVAEKQAGDDWTTWPGASAGDVVRVVRRTGSSYDYDGYGPFGDGTFDAAGKGMPVEEVVGEATITAMNGDVATFDRPLPSGDVAYLDDGTGLPADGDPVTARAGQPGFAFARVLADGDGRRMVPHFEAVDVVSDNRLLPQESFTTTHRFAATCADPTVTAELVYRKLPVEVARERGYSVTEQVMTTVTR